MLSHRYGSRPTPATIRESLFEQLMEIIRSNDDEKDLLSNWYRLDTNQIPPVYVLVPISSKFPEILSSVNKKAKFSF